MAALLDAETDPDRRANNDRALAAIRQPWRTLVPPRRVPGGDLSYFIEYTERAAAFDR